MNMTQEQILTALAELREIKFSGVLRTRDKDGKEVMFRDMSELDAAIAALEGMLGARQRVSFVQHSRN